MGILRKKEGKSFDKLYQSLNLITEKFRKIGADKEAQYHYLEMILQQVRIGVKLKVTGRS